MELNKIKARLYSISPAALNGLPRGVQRLIENDMPKLIAIAEAAISQCHYNSEDTQECLTNAVEALNECSKPLKP